MWGGQATDTGSLMDMGGVVVYIPSTGICGYDRVLSMGGQAKRKAPL